MDFRPTTVAPMSLSDVFGVLSLGLFILTPLVAAIVVALLTRGRVRVLGVAGFAVFVVEGVLAVLWVVALPQIADSLSLPLAAAAGAYSAVRAVLSLVAIALLMLAVVLDRDRAVRAV
jgi:hypothetical protein